MQDEVRPEPCVHAQSWLVCRGDVCPPPHACPPAPPPAGALPLHDAAAGGYTAICEMLLDAAPGCIDRGDSEGARRSAAAAARALGSGTACVTACQCRVCPCCPIHSSQCCTPSLATPLHLFQHPSCLPPGPAGDTPLHNAARGQHEAVVQLLVDRGADVSLQNDDFKTALQLAERGSPCREVLEAAAAAAGGETLAPEPAPPAAEVA